MLQYGWQPDSALWAQISITLRNSRSWRYVPFLESEAGSVPVGKSGVYLLCTSPVGRRLPREARAHDLFANLFTPIYIGRTDDLQRRFLDHCRRPSPKLFAARRCFGPSMQFWFHRLAADQTRHSEATLIACFGPTANDKQETIRASVKNPIPIGIHDR